jgi:hypothetical protein
MDKMKRIWFKALGEKSGSTDEESDAVAWVRTILILQAVATNCFIISGVLRHW